MKSSSIKRAHRSLTLGDLVLAVSSSSRTSREATAAVADLLNSGRVRPADKPGTRYHVA